MEKTLTAQTLFKELESRQPRPFYLVVGEEPFQAAEIGARARATFVRGEGTAALNYEAWDGEGLDGASFRQSLETLPGLFDEPNAIRLVVCHRFEKASAGALELLESYFADPSPTSCLLLFCGKADKRKAFYRSADAAGAVIEIREPFDREWPKWQSYFERRAGKKIETVAWERIVDGAGRTLAAVWGEVQKAAAFAGEAAQITSAHCAALYHVGGADLFDFIEDVACRRRYPAMRRFHELLRGGESEIKLLSLLVRQFRLIDQLQQGQRPERYRPLFWEKSKGSALFIRVASALFWRFLPTVIFV